MSTEGDNQSARQEKARPRDHRQRRRHHLCQGWYGVTARSHPQAALSQRDQALAQAVATLLRPLLEEMNRRLDAILTQFPEPERQPAAPQKRPTAPQPRRRARP